MTQKGTCVKEISIGREGTTLGHKHWFPGAYPVPASWMMTIQWDDGEPAYPVGVPTTELHIKIDGRWVPLQ